MARDRNVLNGTMPRTVLTLPPKDLRSHSCQHRPRVLFTALTGIYYNDRNFCLICLAGRYVIGGSRGDILVIRDARPDDASSYSCEAQHMLTGDKRRSSPAMVAVSRVYINPLFMTISAEIKSCFSVIVCNCMFK